jgi:hypothetical protein
MHLAGIFVQWVRPGSMSNHSKIVDTCSLLGPCLTPHFVERFASRFVGHLFCVECGSSIREEENA